MLAPLTLSCSNWQTIASRSGVNSQMLARLRNNNLVATRRHGKAIYYRLADSRTEQMIGLLHTLFCEAE